MPHWSERAKDIGQAGAAVPSMSRSDRDCEQRQWPRWSISLLVGLMSIIWTIAAAQAAESCGNVIDVGALAAEDAEVNHGMDRNLTFQQALFAELTRRTRCQFNLQPDLPRARQWKMYFAGELPIIASAFRTPQRDAAGWYVGYQMVRNVLILRKGLVAGTDPMAILRDPKVTVGIVRGYSLGRSWDAVLADPSTNSHTEIFVNIKTIFHMIDIGRVDAVITSSRIYSDLLPAFNLTGRVSIIDCPAAASDYTGIYLSKKASPVKIAARIGRAIEAMLADQTLTRLYQQTMQSSAGDLFDFTVKPVDFDK